jgi:hypothetical protein
VSYLVCGFYLYRRVLQNIIVTEPKLFSEYAPDYIAVFLNDPDSLPWRSATIDRSAASATITGDVAVGLRFIHSIPLAEAKLSSLSDFGHARSIG